MNTKHTPGPWHVGRVATTQGQHFATTSPNGDHIATIGEAINSHNGSGNAYVNARVIAAAPELLEACIEALSLFDNYPACWEAIGTYEVLSNAIAKAKATM